MSVMGNAYPASSDRKQRSGLRAVRDGDDAGWDNEATTDMAAVLAENARLRTLVVKLSDIVLRNAIERK
jgi:hypothetical protein